MINLLIVTITFTLLATVTAIVEHFTMTDYEKTVDDIYDEDLE